MRHGRMFIVHFSAEVEVLLIASMIENRMDSDYTTCFARYPEYKVGM